MAWDLVEVVNDLRKRVEALEAWKTSLENPKSVIRKGRVNPGVGDPKPVIAFDWDEGLFTGISDAQVERWSASFPAVNVDEEIGKAAAWLAADKRRAKSQYGRFLTGWLMRAQDRGGNRPWQGSRR